MLLAADHEILLKALNHVYICLGMIDIDEQKIKILHQVEHPNEVGLEFDYNQYINEHAEEFGHISAAFLEHFYACELKNIFLGGRDHWELALPDSSFKISFYTDATTQHLMGYLYIALTSDSSDDILRQITNAFVFNSCDYFIYLDPFKDTYFMFASSESGTPLPPSYCSSYSTEIIKYADNYVVSEDRDMVIRKMSLPHVIAELNRNGRHVFYCGIKDAVRGYTRKRIEYRYCDENRTMILLTRTDVTDLWEQEQARLAELQRALELAYTDSLTCLLNHQGFVAKAEEYLDNLKLIAQSTNTAGAALLFLDLDNFKPVNDTYGHPVGDLLLKKVSSMLKTVTDGNNLVGRYGGDEFIILVKQYQDQSQIMVLGERILKGLNEIKYHNNATVKVTGSVGIAFAPQDAVDYHTLVRIADRRLYSAKHMGKNKVVAIDIKQPESSNEDEAILQPALMSGLR